MHHRRSALPFLLLILVAGCSGEDFAVGDAPPSPDGATAEGSSSEAGGDESDASVVTDGGSDGSAEATDEADSPDALAEEEGGNDAGATDVGDAGAEVGEDAPAEPPDAGQDVLAGDAGAGDDAALADVTPDVLDEGGESPVDAGQEEDAPVDAFTDANLDVFDGGSGESDADIPDVFVPLCLEGAKDCEGLQPLICQDGRWINDGGKCTSKCDSVYMVCTWIGRYTLIEPNGPVYNPQYGTYLDNMTGLKWKMQYIADDFRRTHEEAEAICTSEGGRLPTLDEALNLRVQEEPRRKGAEALPSLFNRLAARIWTSTAYDPGYVWWSVNGDIGVAEKTTYKDRVSGAPWCIVP